MSFEREERYIVVKLTDLEAAGQSHAMQEWLRNYHIPTRDCVVVEADWPEYEPTWKAIEARVTGVTHDAGPWVASANGRLLQSDDFTHDVALEVSGDFADAADRIAYARNLAARMNQMPSVGENS